MTFSDWLKRPVYVAQCHTWSLAAKLGLCCHRFRCLPPYRDAAAYQARRLVAQLVRRERANRRGSSALPDAARVTYLWAFTGPEGTVGGEQQALDVRDAALSVLLSADAFGQLFAERHEIPPSVIAGLPGTRQALFETAGGWGRLSLALIPALS